jgi:uncharacterized OB-fold protein
VTALVPQPAGIPLPEPTAVSAPFWDGCARSELLFQRCDGCGRALFDPAVACRWCGGRSLSWERSAGAGTVYSWSTVWRPQSPAFATPYAVVIVDLDEGFRMVSSLVGCEHASVHVGMRVEVTFHDAGSIVLPYFRPAGAAS